MSILSWIERWADASPDRICYIWRENRMTYGELKKSSDAVSHWIGRTCGHDQAPVLVHGHMHPNMPILFLACLKSGHPYIPIDRSIPAERILMIAEDSGARLIFSEQPALLPALPQTIISPDRLTGILAADPADPSERAYETREGDIIYMIYTSGSTGRPKGVQIPAESLSSFITWVNSDFALGDRQIFLNQAPYSFDLSVMSLYPCLTTGGTLWTVDKDMIARPAELLDSLAASGVNVWTSTPSFAEMCLMMPSFSEKILPDLHTFLFCGETLPVHVARDLHARFPAARIINTYGPTESTVAVTRVQIDEQLIASGQPFPVGRCKPDCRILILDADGRPLPEGEKGEIVICGPSVGGGYLNEPEKTKAAFSEMDGQRAYRTKDLGLMKDGMLYYHGRMDSQIKLHGFRMELGEIEHVLSACRYVKQAAVIPVRKGDRYDHLIAIVVPEDHPFEKSYQLSSAIRKELSQYLPGYMLPRKIIYQSSFPMTANGKINRKVLLKEVVQ